MGNAINNVGESLMVTGAILTTWVTLPIFLTLVIRECLKKKEDKNDC